MSETDKLLAELEDLGAIGNKVPEVTALPEYAPVEEAEPTAPEEVQDLDERGHKVVALTDLIVGEFERVIESMTTMRDAVKALKEELAPVGEPLEERVDAGEQGQDGMRPYTPQGDPDAMGNIVLNIPPGVPLPNEE